MVRNLTQLTNGPDARHGQGSCGKCRGYHESGATNGFHDGCCCCDPCRHIKTTAYDSVVSAADKLKNKHCCRCVPIAICALFTPNPGSSACCAQLGTVMFADSTTDLNRVDIYYNGEIGDVDIRLTVRNLQPYVSSVVDLGTGSAKDNNCVWLLESTALAISEQIVIDHVNSTCLAPLGFSISGVTLSLPATPCTGTITFSIYEGEKVDFRNRWFSGGVPIDPYDGSGPDLDLGTGSGFTPCECTKVAKVLCVYGRRTIGGDVEQVEFLYEENVGEPRWKYLPPCGTPSLHTEYIRLRGTGGGAGSCYLEFDFTPSGDTNDWAAPPNTVGTDPNEIRPGMVAIGSTCGCGLVAEATSTGDRFVRVRAGYCTRWKHLCDACRCVPKTLCIIGYLDGTVINTVVTWDGLDSWVGDGSFSDIRLTLQSGPPCTLGSGDQEGCFVGADNTVGTANPLRLSLPVECGLFMTFELESDFTVGNSTTYNWLWAQSNVCGCPNIGCGPCYLERCGGPPSVLYADLLATGTPRMDTCLGEFGTPTSVSLTVQLHFFQRWMIPITNPPVLICGWVGYSVVSCDTGDFLIRVQWVPQEGSLEIYRRFPDGSWIPWAYSTPIEQVSCDPFIYQFTSEEFAIVGGEICFWGCECVTQYSVTVSE